MKINFRFILRNFWRQKLFTIINVVGLSIGLSCAIIIFLFIEFETSFDSYHSNHKNTYRIVRDVYHNTGMDRDGAIPYPIGHTLRTEYSEYDFSRIYNASQQDVIVNDQVYSEENILYVDSVFFTVFDYEWIDGTAKEALKEPNYIILSESIAKKYFQDENPIGKTLIFSPDYHLQVSGVIKDAPVNSSQPYSMIVSTEFLNDDIVGLKFDRYTITLSGFETYVKFPSSVNVSQFEEQINQLLFDKYSSEDDGDHNTFKLQPIKRIHTEPAYQTIPNTYSTTSKSLWVYSFIGLLIIVIAVINFVNLSTAQGMKRSKEVGVRKVLGAAKTQLSGQFVIETSFLVFLAIVIATVLVEVLLPSVNQFLGNNFSLSIYNSNSFIYFILFLFVIVNFLTSLYPATILTRFNPISALKNTFLAPSKGSKFMRNALVVFQFVISISLAIGAITIYQQVDYLNNKDLGFDKENIVNFDLPDFNPDLWEAIDEILMSEPGVISYGYGAGPPSSSSNLRTTFTIPDIDPDNSLYVNFKPADSGYYQTFGLKLLAGEWLGFSHHSDTIYELVINEKLFKTYDISSPEEALGRKIKVSNFMGKVIGVVKDFHLYSLKREIEPLIFCFMPQYYFQVYLKVNPNRMKETIENVTAKMQEIYPKYSISYEIYEDDLKDSYSDEQRMSQIIILLSLIAIFIASMGLFGLVSFMILQRVKELGVRKVLGATFLENMMLLSKNYLKLVILSSLIAIPIGWYFMNRWLEEFNYRTNLDWWVFILASFFAIILALLTILYHVIKSSNANPVESLKAE